VAIVFKDLQKLVQHLQQENTCKELFERLQGNHFWIWNIQEHKQEDVRTNRGCCFNHIIIGLSHKDVQVSLFTTMRLCIMYYKLMLIYRKSIGNK
jgi:hypothetical protein